MTSSSLPVDTNSKFIVSIASYPERDFFIPAVFQALTKQSVWPEFWVLVLSQEEYPKGLPKHLLKLKRRGLKILWSKQNPYAVKKLLPTMTEFPEKDIVTFDDDFIYYKKNLERLQRASEKYQGDVIGLAGKVLYKKNESLNMFYRYSESASLKSNPYSVYLLAGSGTYYPNKVLHAKAFKLDKIKEIVPGRGSDMWFWAAACANGAKHICIGEIGKYCVGYPIPENKNTKTRDLPSKTDLNLKFLKTIDYFGIKHIVLNRLENRAQ